MGTSRKLKHDFWNHAKENSEDIEQATIKNQTMTSELISSQINNNIDNKDGDADADSNDDANDDAQDDDNDSIGKCNKMICLHRG